MNYSCPSTNKCRSGFTLIELLTVIAIIGILAAILIPTVGSVREKAKQAKCGSNLRQWSVAILTFANENRGVYAIQERYEVSEGGGTRFGNWYWYQFVNPMLYGKYFGGATGFGMCPSQDIKEGASSIEQTGYMLTRPSVDSGGTPITGMTVPFHKVRNPSRYVLMVERAFDATLSPVSGNDFESPQLTNANARSNSQGFTRHSGRMATAWGDGHISRTTYSGDLASSWNERGDGTNFNFRRWLCLNN